MAARLSQRLAGPRGQLASRPVCRRRRSPRTHPSRPPPHPPPPPWGLRRASLWPLGTSRTDTGRRFPRRWRRSREAACGAGGPGLKWAGQRLFPPDTPSLPTLLGSEFTIWPREGLAGFGTTAFWGETQQWAFTQPAPLSAPSLPPSGGPWNRLPRWGRMAEPLLGRLLSPWRGGGLRTEGKPRGPGSLQCARLPSVRTPFSPPCVSASPVLANDFHSVSLLVKGRLFS